ncbi:MAG: endoribonuclease MazF [Candidimonas sp.]
MTKRYIPDTGDIVRVHFDVPAGGGLSDHKTAVVISPAAYNRRTGLFVCCAVTSAVKHYPFEVALQSAEPAVALADQVKSLDWANTKISRQSKAGPTELAQIRAKLHALLFKD